MEKWMLSVLCLLLPSVPVLGTVGSLTNTSAPPEMEDVQGVPSKAEVWGYGLLMVTVISLASVAGVVVMPIMSKTFYSKLMTGLIGLAVGSLAASSVFHLIPGAFRDPKSHTQIIFCLYIYFQIPTPSTLFISQTE